VSSSPKVVISVISHSDRAKLADCLEALATAGHPRHDSRVWVLDNASDDQSAELVRTLFPGVDLIAQSFRDGFGANHNRVLAATDSQYIFLLNFDALVGSRTIDELVALMDARPEIAAAGPRVTAPDGRPQESAWQFTSIKTMILFALTFGRLRASQSEGTVPRRVEHLSGCAMMLRRSLVESVHGFDEAFFMYCEDADLCRRLTQHGHEVWFTPRTSVLHHGHSAANQHPKARVVEEWRSRKHLWRKHYGPLTSIVCSWLRGLPYGLSVLPLAALRVIPGSSRPRDLGAMIHQLKNAWLGPSGPGLREVASSSARRGSAAAATKAPQPSQKMA
jgi:GT2 family glycosyltransferase